MPDRYPPELNPQMSNEKLASRRPLHLMAGMAVVAEYSQLEAMLSRLLTTMLGANPSPAAAIYETLRSAHAQKSALSAVAAQVLSPEDNKRLKALLPLVKQASDFRDEIAHRIWMADEQIADAVVLYEPSHVWRISVQVEQNHPDGTATDEQARAIQEAMRKASRVWTLQDFEMARVVAAHAFVATTALSNAIAARVGSAERLEAQTTFENTLKFAAQQKS